MISEGKLGLNISPSSQDVGNTGNQTNIDYSKNKQEIEKITLNNERLKDIIEHEKLMKEIDNQHEINMKKLMKVHEEKMNKILK